MKTAAKYIVLFILAINIYYLIAWISIFNLYHTYHERVAGFSGFFPVGLSAGNLNVLLLLLTIGSIVLIIRYIRNRAWLVPALLIQLASALFYGWQFL